MHTNTDDTDGGKKQNITINASTRTCKPYHTLFCCIRWKSLPYVLRPFSKFLHSSSDQRVIVEASGVGFILCRLKASSTLYPHCSNKYKA